MVEVQDYRNPRRKPEVTSATHENLTIRALKERGVVKHESADDLDVVMVIRYKGSEQSCLITASGNDTLLFEVGDTGSEAADTDFASAGTMDMSDSDYDTLGEVMDHINGVKNSDGEYTYEAWLVGALRSDDSDVAGALVAVSQAQAKIGNGLSLKRDSSVALNTTFVISGRVNDEPYEPVTAQNKLFRFTGKFTFTGTDYLQVYEIDDEKLTETKIYQQDLGTSTSETDITTWVNTSLGGMMPSSDGKRLLIRATAASTWAVTYMQIVGSTSRF